MTKVPAKAYWVSTPRYAKLHFASRPVTVWLTGEVHSARFNSAAGLPYPIANIGLRMLTENAS